VAVFVNGLSFYTLTRTLPMRAAKLGCPRTPKRFIRQFLEGLFYEVRIQDRA
jgi:hypothetical protein